MHFRAQWLCGGGIIFLSFLSVLAVVRPAIQFLAPSENSPDFVSRYQCSSLLEHPTNLQSTYSEIANTESEWSSDICIAEFGLPFLDKWRSQYRQVCTSAPKEEQLRSSFFLEHKRAKPNNVSPSRIQCKLFSEHIYPWALCMFENVHVNLNNFDDKKNPNVSANCQIDHNLEKNEMSAITQNFISGISVGSGNQAIVSRRCDDQNGWVPHTVYAAHRWDTLNLNQFTQDGVNAFIGQAVWDLDPFSTQFMAFDDKPEGMFDEFYWSRLFKNPELPPLYRSSAKLPECFRRLIIAVHGGSGFTILKKPAVSSSKDARLPRGKAVPLICESPILQAFATRLSAGLNESFSGMDTATPPKSKIVALHKEDKFLSRRFPDTKTADGIVDIPTTLNDSSVHFDNNVSVSAVPVGIQPVTPTPVIRVLWSSRKPYFRDGKLYKPHRDVVNEEEIMNHLKSRFAAQTDASFKVEVKDVNFGALKFEDQAKMVHASDVLVGVHGAGLTLQLFLPKRSAVLELFGGDRATNNLPFHNMARMLGHYYTSTSLGREMFVQVSKLADMVSDAVAAVARVRQL